MAAISIETKKMTDLDQATVIGLNDLVLVHTANGMRVCTVKALLDGGAISVPVATTTTPGIIKPDGTTLMVKTDGTASAVIPDPTVAAVGTLGVVKPDGTTVTIKADGTISAKQTSTPTATTAVAGVVKPDGTTVTITTDGTISAKQAEVATAAKVGLVKPDGATLSVDANGTLKVVGGGGLSMEGNAGAHNSIYRGKNLGSAVTAAQYQAIANGTFDDLYIGDYWTINNVTYRIAAFDYYLRTGDTDCTTHHVTLVPDVNMYTNAMNSSNVTTGGYIESVMYKSGLTNAKNTINTAFGAAHILTHRQLLCNAVANGRPSGGSWYDSTVELMTEQNVYGGKVFGTACDGTNVPYLYTVDKSQYPLFAHRPDLISNRQTYWLRDVVSAADFAYVYAFGNAYCNYASGAGGVRPAFSIKS